MKGTVGITGMTGYIGSWVAYQLLEKGYLVKGIVRNTELANNLVKQNIWPHQENISFIKVDLDEPQEKWDEAFKGCEYAMHVASPTEEKNEEVMKRQAKEGTVKVLKACTANKVKKVVITSSAATVIDFFHMKKLFTEKDYAPEKPNLGYPLSKVLAEKAAFEYYKNQPQENRFDMCAILPTTTIGPMLYKMKPQSSIDFIYGLMSGSGGVLDWMLPHVDVRDVACAHVKALELSHTDGKRYLVHNRTMWMKDVQQILEKEMVQYGIVVKKKKIPKIVFSIVGIFKRDVRLILGMFGFSYEVSNELMKKELKMDLIPLERSIIDTAYSMLEHQMVKQ